MIRVVRLLERHVSLLILMLCWSSISVADEYTLGPLRQVSGLSPFEDCEADKGISFGGVNFLNSAVEPWVVVNPTDHDNIVGFWQQDRWSNSGARGNVLGVSFDGARRGKPPRRKV